MTDFWGDEQYRRIIMEERLAEAAACRVLAAGRKRIGPGLNLESLKSLANSPRLDKTIVLGGLRVRITAG
jgi:hypothetical protein